MLRAIIGLCFSIALLVGGLFVVAPTLANLSTTHTVARYPDGTIHSEYNLDSNGFVHGLMTEYHRNGQVAVIAEFKHGEAVGVSLHYDEDGNEIY